MVTIDPTTVAPEPSTVIEDPFKVILTTLELSQT